MDAKSKPVIIWLALVCLSILAMVVVGGVTRLTGSGLSMVTWEPLLGAIPPLNQKQWEHRFAQYQQFPEYREVNHQMTLPEFKRIFFWEYLHRLLGRSIGGIFALPFLVFWIRRCLPVRLAWKLAVAFLLGGLQGALGWWMVKSGLVDDPRVSHFRLAAHLGLALLLLGYLFWLLLDLVEDSPAAAPAQMRRWSTAFFAVLVAQILYGALVAGLDAGLLFNTFPLMMGDWIPELTFAPPVVHQMLHNPMTVQWVHRTLGWLLGLMAVSLAFMAFHPKVSCRQRAPLVAVATLTFLQFGLGVATLLLAVPVWLGALHQLNAAILMCAALWALHRQSARRA